MFYAEGLLALALTVMLMGFLLATPIWLYVRDKKARLHQPPPLPVVRTLVVTPQDDNGFLFGLMGWIVLAVIALVALWLVISAIHWAWEHSLL